MTVGRYKILQSWPFVVFFLSSCASNPRVKPPEGVSRIRRVAVVRFRGSGGDVITQEVIRQLRGSGVAVSEQLLGADAVLSGEVTEYNPDEQLRVFLGTTTTVTPTGQSLLQSNPIVLANAAQVTAQGPAFQLENSQIVSVSAEVGLAARLVVSPSGKVVWSDEFSYEGLDMPKAVQVVVNVLVKSLCNALRADKGPVPKPVAENSSRGTS